MNKEKEFINIINKILNKDLNEDIVVGIGDDAAILSKNKQNKEVMITKIKRNKRRLLHLLIYLVQLMMELMLKQQEWPQQELKLQQEKRVKKIQAPSLDVKLYVFLVM